MGHSHRRKDPIQVRIESLNPVGRIDVTVQQVRRIIPRDQDEFARSCRRKSSGGGIINHNVVVLLNIWKTAPPRSSKGHVDFGDQRPIAFHTNEAIHMGWYTLLARAARFNFPKALAKI